MFDVYESKHRFHTRAVNFFYLRYHWESMLAGQVQVTALASLITIAVTFYLFLSNLIQLYLDALTFYY